MRKDGNFYFEKKMPLLNNWLLLFIFAMILANIGGNMYGPLMPLYLQKLNASVAQVGLFFTLSRIIPLAAANCRRIYLRLAGAAARDCDWQCGGHFYLRGADRRSHPGNGFCWRPPLARLPDR